MDTREKAASIATALNVTLTIVKFALYTMTGSLAILAEAWHSLSDIATSALTFIAVRRTVVRERAETAEPPDNDKATSAQSDAPGTAPVRPRPSAEQVISLIVSLVILGAGLSLVAKVVWHQPVTITNPLLAGVLFLVFSLGSYLVHRLEIDVGQRSGSAGLVADGMHARADMIASLLTGVSLVLYHLGFNLDRAIAALIAALILSVAVETVVNLIVGYTRGQTRYVPHYRSHEILAKVLSLAWLVHVAGQIAGMAGVDDVTSRLLPRFRRWVSAGIVVAVVLVYGRTCFFTVGLAQEGIVEHFGRSARREVQPGLHAKWPWPIDRVILVDKAVVQVTRIGNETDPQAFALIWTREHGTEVPFLAGDNNFFYPYLVIHWRIKDTFDVVYRQQSAAVLLDVVGHRVMSELCAKAEFYDLASTYRKRLAQDVHADVQKRLDALDSGIEIVSVNLSDVHPPVFIADAFEEVVVARFQETQQLVNEAMGYRNQRLADAGAQAAKQKAKAEAYRLDKEGRATGQAGRFVLRSEAYREGPEITRDRIYLEQAVESLRDVPKVLIEPEAGTPDVWMGFRGPAGGTMSLEESEQINALKRQLE